ncbi:E3 ubiquitin-protein ligase [Canna indica]|uniref:RING-type E3 ubiquitin transferase n=1 Tax=Canna indica TaxID=4628 RepID=A0AAQ3L2H0_9LILI|nr:E3 ubiquitin-protein ligase [Canna indica]
MLTWARWHGSRAQSASKNINFAIMFSLTFLLLVYAKFCYSAAAKLFSIDPAGPGGNGRLLLPEHRFSGIGKAAIESLPSFCFASLRGVRGGLECTVCLSKFDDADVLRLLPKCKHAFHVACVDRWLEAHSTCPLCHRKVDAEDAALFKLPTTNSWFLFPSSRWRPRPQALY